MNLLKKEFRLCMHPAAWIMLGLCLLILIPNYPYTVSFFYMTLGIFFISQGGRENHDASYTLSLPVSRSEAVKGRILFCCCLEVMQLAAAAVIVLLKSLLGAGPNGAGMDANIALLGEGLILFSLFNLIFFPGYYRDIRKIGKPFIIASIAVFLYITAGVAATYAVPLVRDRLDTPDPEHMAIKLVFFGASAVVYAAFTGLAVRLSVKRFEKLDLQL